MRRAYSLLIVWILFTALAQGATAPSEFIAPHFVRADEGADESLPSMVLTSLVEDSRGMLWAGTARGVMRFDGHRFRTWGNRWSAPFGETSIFVRTLYMGHDGTVWVGSDFAGLVRYDAEQDQLVPVELDVDLPKAYSANTIVEDAQGHLWIGTDGQGLIERWPDGRIRHWRHQDGSGLPDNRINRLFIDKRGTLWVGTWSGLYALAPGAAAFAATGDPTLDVANITALHQGSDGQLWVGSAEGDLWRLSADDLRVLPVTDGVRRGAINDFLELAPDTLWLARSDGIDIRDATDGRLQQHVRHVPGNPHSLGSNDVRALLRDRGGLVWLGGYGGGLQRHNPANTAFRLLDRHALAAGGAEFEDPNVRSALERQDGHVLIGTQDHGILELDAELRPLGVLKDAQGQTVLKDVRVTALAEGPPKVLWIGSDAGLLRRDEATAEITRFEFPYGGVRRLLATDDSVWVASEDGLLHLASGAKELTRLLDDHGQLVRRSVNALALDSKGDLWLGGEFGLGRVPKGAMAIERVAADHPARSGNPDVIGLMVDAEDAVWLDTPSGLYRLHPPSNGSRRLEAISADYGQPGQPFGANLLMDGRGRIWSPDHFFDPATHQLAALGKADGVDIGTPWFRAHAPMRDGRLLFGGSLGLLVVDPSRFELSHYQPPLVLTDVRVDGVSTAPVRVASSLSLLPGQRRLEIEFAALDYSAPDQLHYRHRLLGDNDTWMDTDAGHRVASWANLDPGEYRFELQGSDRHGNFSTKHLVLPITVEPLWWQRTWVRILGLIGFLLAIQGVIRQRTRWLRARQHELERRVVSRTQQLQALTAELQAKSKALEEASLTDPLTGLRNRRHFSQFIETQVHEIREQMESRDAAAKSASGLSFFLFDIDHFKHINDQFGHAAGDAVLQQVAMRLRESFEPSTELVRWGGEEFLAVARGVDAERAMELAEQTIARLNGEGYVLPDQRVLQRTCSLGVAMYPLQPAFPHQMSWQQTLELADQALYLAKRSGRNAWVGFVGGSRGPVAPSALTELGEELRAGHIELRGSLEMPHVLRLLSGSGHGQSL